MKKVIQGKQRDKWSIEFTRVAEGNEGTVMGFTADS
jgi:hypothetical protein